MEEAAARLQFERAAQIRDQLAALANVQSQQNVTGDESANADAFAIVGEPGEYAVSVMLVRGGRNLGTTSYFPRAALADPDEALGSFILNQHDTDGDRKSTRLNSSHQIISYPAFC